MKNLVSIIVPVYNAEKYLDRCLDSIINQTYNNLEIILINDGSTDNSKKILNQYAKKDSRIIVYNQKNKGAAATRNKGIKNSTGKYITFVDADDSIEKDYIEILVSGMKKNVDIVLSGYIKCFDKKRKMFVPKNSEWDKFKYAATWCKLYRRNFLIKNNILYQHRLIMEDVEFNIACFIANAKYNVLNYAGYCYYINESSVTNTAKDKKDQIYQAIELFKKIDLTATKNKKKYKKDTFINFYILYFMFIVKMCCLNASLDYMQKAFNEFYTFLNEVDSSWYKIKSIKNESIKNNLAIFVVKKAYKYNLKKWILILLKKENKKKKKNKIIKIIAFILVVFVLLFTSLLFYKTKKEQEQKTKFEYNKIYNEIISNYNDFVKTIDQVYLYELVDGSYNKVKKVSKNFYLELEGKEQILNYKDAYYKVKGTDYYIYYKDVIKTEKMEFNNRYKKFIPWNQSVKINDYVFIYYDDQTYTEVEPNRTYPIIIKDGSNYYIEYNNRLGYIKLDDSVEIINEVNTNESIADKVAVLCYHYVFNSALGERCLNGEICHEESQIIEQFTYLSQNNWFTPNMNEFEMYLDGKIQLPKKSVVITIDDGWWVPRMRHLLIVNKLNGTLFLIGTVGKYEDYYAEGFLEVHSHTYDLHKMGICPGGMGSAIRCSSREIILNDLAKSRETLYNSTVFGWPFYEYNDYAIGLLKEAGFRMAFIGGMYKAYPGVNKYLIPRYTIHNTTSLSTFISYIS